MSRARIFVGVSLAILGVAGAAYQWTCTGPGTEAAPARKAQYSPHPPAPVPIGPAQHIEIVLGAGLLDDGDRTDDGSSLADVVQGWLESPAFARLVDRQIRRRFSATEHCDVRMRGRCLVSSQRRVTGARLWGPSTVRLEIVRDLVLAEVWLRDLTIDIEGQVETARVPASLQGQIEVQDLVFRTALTLRVADHRLRVEIHDSDAQLGRIDARLGGLSGRLAGSLIGHYERDVRQMAEAALTEHVSAAVSTALAEAVGSLQLVRGDAVVGGALGAEVAVTLRLTALSVTPDGIRAGLFVDVQGEPAQPASTRAATAAVAQAWASADLGMLEQCLTALWRQDVLTTSIPGAVTPRGAGSAAVQATVSREPRLSAASGNRLAVVLPGIELRAELPWLGGSTVVGQGEATVSVALGLRDGALVLSDPHVDALEIRGLVLSAMLAMNPGLTQATIADIATQALSSVVRVVPVPSIELPAWLRRHGPSRLTASEGTVWVQDRRVGVTIPQVVVH